MKNIAVIIRVYSRTEDTKALLSLIKTYWKQHNYTTYVVHNGAKDGYVLSDEVYKQANVIEVTTNSGHRAGAKDLVNAAYAHIQSESFDYILFIESDFWILDDTRIHNVIESQADLGTSIWIEKRQSYAVDFFLVKKSFLDTHPEILDWQASPETSMAVTCRKLKANIYIFQSLDMIHAPSLLRRSMESRLKPSHYDGGRFRLFPKARALSHHVETLEHGMATKKALANTMLGERHFDVAPYEMSFLDKHVRTIACCVPHWGRLRWKLTRQP